MIVRHSGDRLELITQPDHAQLARRILEQSTPLAAHPRREAILHAIGEHDNGWSEEDAQPRLDLSTGQIIDFINAPIEVKQAVWPRGVGRLMHDRWAAALVAQHALTIYSRFIGDPAWAAFFSEMQRLRDGQLKESGAALNDLIEDYTYVRLGDLISLTFCTGWTDEQRFGDYSIQPLSTRLVVAPDLFGGTTVPIAVAARAVHDGPFASERELVEAVARSAFVEVRGEVSGGNL